MTCESSWCGTLLWMIFSKGSVEALVTRLCWTDLHVRVPIMMWVWVYHAQGAVFDHTMATYSVPSIISMSAGWTWNSYKSRITKSALFFLDFQMHTIPKHQRTTVFHETIFLQLSLFVDRFNHKEKRVCSMERWKLTSTVSTLKRGSLIWSKWRGNSVSPSGIGITQGKTMHV